MNSVSGGHIILTPTQPVERRRPERGSNPGMRISSSGVASSTDSATAPLRLHKSMIVVGALPARDIRVMFTQVVM